MIRNFTDFPRKYYKKFVKYLTDIDLTLKGGKLNLKVLNRISLDLDDLFLPYTFDISIFHQIDNPDLIEHIQRVGEIFYSTNCPVELILNYIW